MSARNFRILMTLFILAVISVLYQLYVILDYRKMTSRLELEIKAQTILSSDQKEQLEICRMEAIKQRQIADELFSKLNP